MEYKKSCLIIGSGTMGSGIAAHLCNANIPVTFRFKNRNFRKS